MFFFKDNASELDHNLICGQEKLNEMLFNNINEL